MRKVSAADFRHYVPEGDGSEPRNTYIELGQFMRNHLVAEFRCCEPLVVSGVDEDGQTVFLGDGKVVYLDGLFDGFVSIEVQATAAYCYWFRVKGRWLEVPDPVPLAVKVDEPKNKPVADLVRQELARYLARRSMDQELATDVSVEELLDDIEKGDLEFEEEPDPFGLGYEERMAAFEARQEASSPPAEQNTGAAAAAPVAAPTGDAGQVQPAGDAGSKQITT